MLKLSLRLLLASFLVSVACLAQKQAQSGNPRNSDLFLKVELANTIKTSKLHPGDLIWGTVSRDVYSSEQKLIPAGSPIRLTVNKLEKRRRPRNDHWPWVIQAFTPRHENFPIFQSAAVTMPNGSSMPFEVSWFALRRERRINAPPPTSDTHPAKTQKQSAPSQVITLEASRGSDATSTAALAASHGPRGPIVVPAGTEGKIILLESLSAGKSHPGDAFQARLIEPIKLESGAVIPEGTILSGNVAKRTPPKMLSRAGSLFLTFTGLQFPGQQTNPTTATIMSAQLDQRSHTRIDREGEFKGERPGKAWMLINIGVTAGIAKEVDDGLQLVTEAVVSTATDVSTAGTARIAATCASGLFILTRHGRDVVLPKFTEMNVQFNRPAPPAQKPPNALSTRD
jgi:hypothetical protein